MTTAILTPTTTKTVSLNTRILPSEVANEFKQDVLSPQQLSEMYRTMFLIRRVEESLLKLAESGKIGGAMHTAIGHEAKAVIRVEQAHVADADGHNRAEVDLVTSMFLGDRYEYVFHAGKDLLRAWGKRHEVPGKRWLELPGDAVWIF